MSDIVPRLRAYRPFNEWGDGVRHTICDEAADEIERLRSRVAELEGVISDPDAVHLNMLRGGIAKPSVRQMLHLHGEEALARWENPVRDELTAESERLGLYDEPVLTNWTVQDVRD